MHPFFLFGAVLHVTALAVIAFFVFFAASKAQGYVRTFGNILGIWLFILAVLAIVGAVTGAMSGNRPYGFPMTGYMRPGWMHPWQIPDQPPPPAIPKNTPPVPK